jgi:hypothetical protein
LTSFSPNFLRHTTGAWIFWLDADDRLDGDNRRKLSPGIGDIPGYFREK